MRWLPLLLLLSAIAGEAPADLGGPAPPLPATVAITAGVPAALVFRLGDDDPAPAQAVVAALAGRIAVVQLVEDAVELGDATAITAAQREAWLGPEPPLPAGALVSADGLLLWRGRAAQLPAQVDRLLAGGFDILQIKRLGGLRAELRRRLESGTDGDLEQALRLTAQILAVEPVDEEALRLRLDLCRHLDRADDFRATLAGLPRDRLDADLANALAWDRLVDEDLAWRHLDLALPLARHARALSPDSGAICDTLARAYYLLGMLDEAIAEQLTAVSLDDDPALRAVLAYYQQALALAKQVRRGVDLPGGRALPGVIVP